MTVCILVKIKSSYLKDIQSHFNLPVDSEMKMSFPQEDYGVKIA